MVLRANRIVRDNTKGAFLPIFDRIRQLRYTLLLLLEAEEFKKMHLLSTNQILLIRAKQTLGSITSEITNNVTNAFNALSIVVGAETQSLDDAIKSGNSLAVKAVIFKGSYQITPNSLNLAIETENPDIVESVVNVDAEVNSAHIILSMKGMPSLDDDVEQKKEKITKNLVDAMRAKGQKIDSEVLMDPLKRNVLHTVKFLISLNLRIKEEHITLASNSVDEYGQLQLEFLKTAREKQIEKTNDAEKNKNLCTLGSGAPNRTNVGFFTNMPKELIMDIISRTGNESKPVTEEEMKSNYYTKPKF